jgi:hypothetical protein
MKSWRRRREFTTGGVNEKRRHEQYNKAALPLIDGLGCKHAATCSANAFLPGARRTNSSPLRIPGMRSRVFSVPTNEVHLGTQINGSEIEFDWDDANIGHVARHSVFPEEAEQVILSDPVDLGMEIAEGEERYLNLGATVQGRVLLVVTTWRDNRVRVVTAFEPIKRLIQFLLPGTKEVIDYGQEKTTLQD